jgi:hypothetical protein
MDFCLWFPPIQAASSKTTLIIANVGNIQFQTIAELVENLYAMNVN